MANARRRWWRVRLRRLFPRAIGTEPPDESKGQPPGVSSNSVGGKTQLGAASRGGDDHGARGGEAPPPATDGPSPAQIPIEDFIDLHTFRPSDTASVVAAYLQEAHARNLRQVRIIHGRGKGVQRRIVRSVLENHPLVVRYQDAPPSRGGWGATTAWLDAAERPEEETS